MYVPIDETVVLTPVWPFDQSIEHPEHGLAALSDTDCPGHKFVELLAEITGVTGAVPTITEMLLEAGLAPQVLL